MTIDIETLLLNHERQNDLIKILQDNIAALQKEKQALKLENEALRQKIADLTCEKVLNKKQRPERMVINIGM